MIAAFFDLDGTLCAEHVWRAFNKYFAKHHRRRIVEPNLNEGTTIRW